METQEIDPIPLSEQQSMMRHQPGSGNIALEDKALAAYHEWYDVDKKLAEKKYFEILKREP